MKADGSSIRLFLHNHHFKSLKRRRKSSKESKSGEIAKSNPLLEAKLSSKFQHSTPNMHRSAFIKSVLNRVPIRSQLARVWLNHHGRPSPPRQVQQPGLPMTVDNFLEQLKYTEIHVLFSGLLSGLCCYWSLSLQVCSNLPWSVSEKGSPWETIKLQPFSPPSVTAGGGKNSAPSVKARESEYLSRDSAGTQLKCAFSTVAKGRSVATPVRAGAETAKGPPGGAGSTFTARVTESQRTGPFAPSSQCLSVWLPSPSDLWKRIRLFAKWLSENVLRLMTPAV